MISGVIRAPCSIVSAPARRDERIPAGLCACAATRMPALCASSQMAAISCSVISGRPA
jgi:hypothetical protein